MPALESAPAVINGVGRIQVFLLHQVPAPVDVVCIQPVVIYRQGVLNILHAVVPATGDKNGFIHPLQPSKRIHGAL